MNTTLKGALVATALVAGSVTSAFAQRVVTPPDQPAPECCNTPNPPKPPRPHHPHKPTTITNTTNNTTNKSVTRNSTVNIPIAIAPNPSVTDAICGKSVSGTVAVGLSATPLSVSGGFAVAKPDMECIRMVTQWHAASSGQCVIAAAAGYVAIDGMTYRQAMNEAKADCGTGAPLPRNKFN